MEGAGIALLKVSNTSWMHEREFHVSEREVQIKPTQQKEQQLEVASWRLWRRDCEKAPFWVRYLDCRGWKRNL
jgi:hypothetical protein